MSVELAEGPAQSNEAGTRPVSNASAGPAVKSSVKKSSQGPLTMWHGATFRTLFELFALRPPISFGKFGRLASLPVLATYNTVMSGVERGLFGRRVANAEVHPQPLFIVGHWRSGTTLLHNLICQDEQFGFPNLYQCVFPYHFLVTEAINVPLTGWMLPKSRPMDNVPCGWDLPQEDEIALCLLSMASPYRMSAFMDEKEKYFRFLDPTDMRPDERQQLRAAIAYFMQKLSVKQLDAAGKPRPLCMKSPTHTFRVAELIDMFPRARFLYIHRHPHDVYNSTLHLRTTMWENNSFAAQPLQHSEEIALEIYCKAIEAYERDKGLIPEGQLHEVPYDDLAANPVDELERSYDALGIDGFDRLADTLRPQLAKIKSYKKNKFVMDAETRRHVYEQARFAFEQYGYDPNLGGDAAVA